MPKDKDEESLLVIADTHTPFEHRNYLDFCIRIKKAFKCKIVVHIGDLVDNHAISYHEHDPDGKSSSGEMTEADRHLVKWFKAFPEVSLCRGNHCELVSRKGKTAGLPQRVFKPFRETWKLPKGWKVAFEFEYYGVLFKHGINYAGKYGHVQAASDARQSCVIGHSHSIAGVEWLANSKDIIFGMNVGCGIDRKAYAFNYGKDFKRKPILGVGLVTKTIRGVNAQFIPMQL